jgi:hypothetical protein
MIDSNNLIYRIECLTSFLCDDIIELSEIESSNKDFIIPKEDNEWKIIEKILYKELLTHLREYKNKLILLNTHDGNLLVEQLSKKLYTKDFKITIKKSLNRFNVISYFFSLYDSIIINDIVYNNVKGHLFLFPEEYKVDTKGIYGQLCFKNV